MAGDGIPSATDDVDRMRAELQREMQIKEMLDKSMEELQQTVQQFEKRHSGVDDENNEWKTRFEIQEEINKQLEKQAVSMDEHMARAKQTLLLYKDSKAPVGTHHEVTEPNEHTIMALEKQKEALLSQVHDLDRRLEQESIAFQKVNEERRHYLSEINATKMSLDNFQRWQVHTSDADPSVRKATYGNIPDGQRILDPKKGPIRKAAAVKSLPKLEGGLNGEPPPTSDAGV